jgi:hypothetical protein
MDGALPIQQPEGHKHHDATVDQVGKPIVSAEVSINMQNPSGHRITVVSTASLEPRLKDFSFKGYTRLEEHYHLKSDPTISSEVMYLPTKGFTVGYEIPELGLRETYDNQSGDAVPRPQPLHPGAAQLRPRRGDAAPPHLQCDILANQCRRQHGLSRERPECDGRPDLRQ